ncbi:MAG: NifU N-terminal domain-containing protein [Armatimonadota bacterium]|nr:NifU N-terminal domain-containing protein [Armatimonadota bacterium]MDR7401531.1 NifU N-terminal domain-containing protein [Armatimonadota bacterium]MDR7403273.1 NifU N-terminal domain-containing protein [Armatimonadota bacterium]MDR7437657.1 NifU N-terminal domain-containing protein [Armatimonadota bacterium]MDR7471661.1 NifU N-terminal domain-containing protein [Armatimonadota bacterium]
MADPLTVDVQPTPNVNALKFVVNRRLTEGRSQTYRTAEDAAASPLAASLLAIPGVVQVFILNDFITLTRAPGADWGTIVAQAERLIREHLA